VTKQFNLYSNSNAFVFSLQHDSTNEPFITIEELGSSGKAVEFSRTIYCIPPNSSDFPSPNDIESNPYWFTTSSDAHDEHIPLPRARLIWKSLVKHYGYTPR